MSSEDPSLVGILGKPSVGKSTFFSAVTLIPVPISSRPFTTIKPNRGIGYVRTECVCKEFGVKDNPVNSACIDGVRLIPVELVDCAGLIPGSHEGRGLGNQFLDEVRKADALVHVVDASGSTDAEGKPCDPGTRDPVQDIYFLEYEVTMWFAQVLKRRWGKNVHLVEVSKERLIDLLERDLSGLNIRRDHIAEAMGKLELDPSKPSSWKEEDLVRFSNELWRGSKPNLIVANKMDLPYAEEHIARLKDLGYNVIPCCAEAELTLRRAAEKGLIDYKPGDHDFRVLSTALTEEQRKALELIREKVFKKFGSTGVQEALNVAFFKLLDTITVFPVRDVEKLTDHHGRVLPDAYLIPRGTTARQLAYKIHEELGKNFIYALDVRSKQRLGEDHMLQDKDVVKIVASRMRG